MLDFYCPAAKLAIEVDGSSHDMGDRPAHDERRDTWLAAQGLHVVRFTVGDVLRNLDGVIQAIVRDCSA